MQLRSKLFHSLTASRVAEMFGENNGQSHPQLFKTFLIIGEVVRKCDVATHVPEEALLVLHLTMIAQTFA